MDRRLERPVSLDKSQLVVVFVLVQAPPGISTRTLTVPSSPQIGTFVTSIQTVLFRLLDPNRSWRDRRLGLGSRVGHLAPGKLHHRT